MGRLQYLERLALGRSAFQPAPIGTDDQGNERQENSNDITTIPNDTGSGIQQYNLKGRPINPETEAQDARLRHASNEVLALVGVVERKESADARIQMDITLKRALREHLLTREDNRGQEWGALADVVAWFALWWPTALVRRIQIGIYSTGLPFTEILSREAHSVFGHGWRGVLLGLLPGTGIAILHKVIWQVLALIVEESVSALQNKIIASRFRRRSTKRIIRSLTIFVDIALVAIDVLLLPLEAYAFACQLQIAPPTPWRPLLTTHLPAFTRTAYHTTFASPASFLASPAPYLIGYSFLTRDASPEAPAFSDVTSYRLPPVSEPISTHTAPPKSPLLDPFGTILYHTWSLRQRLLHLVGWNVYETQHPGATHGWETDIHYESPDEFYDLGVVSHRSTALARLPATWLGMRVDMFLVRILLLPVEGLVMQKLARSYISSGMPLTEAALQAGVGDTIPNPLGLLVSGTVRSGWRGMMEKVSDIGLNQIGLSMAVNLGVEVALFGCLHVLVRRQGIQTFEWGKARDTDRQVESGQE